MNVLVIVFLLDVVAVGVGLSYLSGAALRIEERVGVGAIIGTIAVTLCGYLVAQTTGFGRTSTIVGAGIATLAAGAAWRWRPADGTTWRADVRDLVARARLPWRDRASARPFLVVTAASWVVTWRVLALAYQGDGRGGVVAGHLSTYGDWNAHLAYAGSFVYGDNVPPTQPFVVGEPLTYHVLVDVFAAQAATLGVSVADALVVTSVLLAMAFPLVFWWAGRCLTGSADVTLVAYAVFTLSGGLGFAWAIADVARGGVGTLGALPRTYARLVEEHIWFDNPVLSYLYAQRPFQVGLPVVLIVAALVFRPADEPAAPPRAWWSAGVLTGLTAGFSVFGFGGAMAIGGWLALRRPGCRVPFLLPALGLGVPVVSAISPESNHLRWQPGWMAATLDVWWPWFWLLNLGAFVPLALWALARGGVLRTGFDRAVALPMWTIFAVTNLVAFHPWEWNNTHYLIVWLLVISFPVAGLLVDGARRSGPVWRPVAGVAFVVLIAAGSLDVWRAVDGSEGRALLTTADGLDAAAWVREHTPPQAVFLVAPEITQPITSFGARRVVSGYTGWVWDLGVADWAQRSTDIGIALRGEAGTDEVLARYGVDFVVIGRDERGPNWRANEAYWAERGRLVYAAGEYLVYQV